MILPLLQRANTIHMYSNFYLLFFFLCYRCPRWKRPSCAYRRWPRSQQGIVMGTWHLSLPLEVHQTIQLMSFYKKMYVQTWFWPFVYLRNLYWVLSLLAISVYDILFDTIGSCLICSGLMLLLHVFLQVWHLHAHYPSGVHTYMLNRTQKTKVIALIIIKIKSW